MTISRLRHPIEHGGGYAVLDSIAREEAFQIIHHYIRDVLPHSTVTGGDVRCDDGSRQGAQGVPEGQRLHRIGDVESASNSAGLHLLRQSRKVDQTAAGDVN